LNVSVSACVGVSARIAQKPRVHQFLCMLPQNIGGYIRIFFNGVHTWLMMQRRKMQQSQSADAADASGAAASGGADADASSSGVLKVKAIWKKAVSKLTLRRSKSDDSKSSADSSSTNPGRCATHGSQSRRIGRCVAERTCQLFSDFLRDAVRPHSTTATSTPTPTSSRGNRACRTEM